MKVNMRGQYRVNLPEDLSFGLNMSNIDPIESRLSPLVSLAVAVLLALGGRPGPEKT